MPDFFGKLKSGAEKVAFEADKTMRLNHAQGELNQVKRQVEAQYIKLGELYYQRQKGEEVEETAFAEICQAVDSLKQQVEDKELEVQRIGAEVYNPQGAAAPASAPAAVPSQEPVPATPVAPAQVEAVPPAVEAQPRFCPNCGKEQPAQIKFCTECGTKLG